MLELDGLTKRYGALAAADGVSFVAARGRLTGLLGPNGAGKTTVMRSILGLVAPDAGTIVWDGAPVDRAARLRFGYLPEQRGLYPKMRVIEQVTWFGRLHGMGADEARSGAEELLELVGLTDRAGDMVESLSHGNQQRVQLAVALVHDPDLLVLDEPFSGLDPLGVTAMSEALVRVAGHGAAVILSSHQLDLVEDVCEDVVMLAAGRVVRSGPLHAVREADGTSRLRIEVADGSLGTWRPPDGVDVLARTADAATVAATVDDLEAVLASLHGRPVRRFAFEAPSLSEVFRSAVAA